MAIKAVKPQDLERVIVDATRWSAPVKGKARKPYEFGVKNVVVVSHQHGLMLGARTFPGNPFNGYILSAVLEQATNLTQDLSVTLEQVLAGLGSEAKPSMPTTPACRSFTGDGTRA